MANYRLNFSDGTTTIDLYSGNARVREAGLELPPPRPRTAYVESSFADGGRLVASNYENRTVTIRLRLVRTSLANLKATIREIERLLTDAEKRTISGYGAQVYLEYQWGDAAGQSVYFDVLRGSLSLPSGFFNSVLANNYSILDAVLTLECKPFARYANQDIAQDTLENSQSIYDYKDGFLTGDDTQVTLDAANDWEAMTFQASATYTPGKASILAYKLGTPGDITFAIYAIDGAGKPTGAALCWGGTTSGNNLGTSSTYLKWLTHTFLWTSELTNGTTYALVIHGASLTGANILYWRVDTAPGYATGNRVYSTDGGASWTVDATRDCIFAIMGQETSANYQDVTTAEAHGDVGARIYHKIDQAGATGSKKIWIAKRSGSRQTDDLWAEGEEASSDTVIDATGNTKTMRDVPDSGISGGLYHEFWLYQGTVTTPASTELARLNYTLATVPKGQFRVLARVRQIEGQAGEFDHMKFGFGWSYGGKTKTPSAASGEYYSCAANNTWEILDLGELTLPPVPESDIAGNSSFELRIYCYANELLQGILHWYWQVDWIFLLPIDEGVVILDAIADTDILAIDGITDPPNVFKITADLITDYPDRVGNPFVLGRESTRIYVLRNDVKAVTFASDLKYQPQHILI